MKLHLLSDLHLEFGPLALPPTDADVVVLAGDIHLGAKGVDWAKKTFKTPVIYVPGNHEAYSENLSSLGAKLKQAAQGSHVQVLLNETVEIFGVRFIGTTLWSDFKFHDDTPAAMRAAQIELEDFKRIRFGAGYSRLRPADTRKLHVAALNLLRRQLETPFAGKTVVVTHHAPSGRSVPEQYQDHPLTPAYASRLDSLFGPAVSYWLHGHLHGNVDFTENGTRVLCNPRGYDPDELNPEFNPGFVVELE